MHPNNMLVTSLAYYIHYFQLSFRPQTMSIRWWRFVLTWVTSLNLMCRWSQPRCSCSSWWSCPRKKRKDLVSWFHGDEASTRGYGIISNLVRFGVCQRSVACHYAGEGVLPALAFIPYPKFFEFTWSKPLGNQWVKWFVQCRNFRIRNQ